jgi:CRP-like cAMP-binding protein
MPVRTLSRVLTQALTRLEDDLLASADPEETRRTASALATLAGVYGKLTQTVAIEEQVESIRGELQAVRKELDADRANALRTAGAGSSAAAPDVN